tara:strand:- start:907 stop:1224 length:318 start_codon:yes stop_codon:yes gene_type:complete
MMASLVLCSHDFEDQDGFCYSKNIFNKILYLNKLDKSKKDKVISFLDGACGLFDKEVYDYNKVSNIIKMLHTNFEVIDRDTLLKIQKFLIMYKHFGISLFLVPEE